MKWEGNAESGNVEDRRGMSPGLVVGGGGSVLLVILALVLGVNPMQVLKQANPPQQGAPVGKDDRTRKFVATVLGFTETVWDEEFRRHSGEYRARYEKPKLVLFSTQVKTGGCGVAPSEVGPFYCPADKTVYIDPTFFDELERKLGGSKGEFSQAYVIAHEVGHHVQNLLGYSARADSMRGGSRENEGSVRLELQADYLAGVWAHHGQKKFNFIEPGDVDSAITSAKAIGDDRLQKRAGKWPSPEGYTHGTSAQRVQYFTEGLKTGDASKPRLDRFFTTAYDARRGELRD
jgi:predicted metalloprotease